MNNITPVVLVYIIGFILAGFSFLIVYIANHQDDKDD